MTHRFRFLHMYIHTYLCLHICSISESTCVYYLCLLTYLFNIYVYISVQYLCLHICSISMSTYLFNIYIYIYIYVYLCTYVYVQDVSSIADPMPNMTDICTYITNPTLFSYLHLTSVLFWAERGRGGGH
jgi:hypothetical protein